MRRCRILLVEDNPHLREALGEAITDAGLLVAVADSAEAAGTAIHGQPFDLLVTDINLERPLAGLEVADIWREQNGTAPLIFATAYPRADIRTRLRLRATDGYLTKPFTPSDLLSLITFLLHSSTRRFHAEAGTSGQMPPGQGTEAGAATGSVTGSATGSAIGSIDTVPWIS